MYNLLVLGIVPGTNLQITFEAWLEMLGLVVILAISGWLYTQRHPFRPAMATRLPLHASQLHHRG